jgi:hypothetical protein
MVERQDEHLAVRKTLRKRSFFPMLVSIMATFLSSRCQSAIDQLPPAAGGPWDG